MDSKGSTFQETAAKQCAVVAAKQIIVPVDCEIPFISSSFLSAWKNEKWFVSMLRIWGWGEFVPAGDYMVRS